MKKLRFTLLIAAWLVSTFAIAQNGVSIGNWRTHLPYQKVIGVEPVGSKIYAATQYELFYFDTQDNSINVSSSWPIPMPTSTSSTMMATSTT